MRRLTKSCLRKSQLPQKASGKEEDVGFRELYEQSLQSVQLGQIVTGKVVQINSDVLMVDVGWKTEGYIPARELKDEEGNIPLPLVDELEVLVNRRDTDGIWSCRGTRR